MTSLAWAGIIFGGLCVLLVIKRIITKFRERERWDEVGSDVLEWTGYLLFTPLGPVIFLVILAIIKLCYGEL